MTLRTLGTNVASLNNAYASAVDVDVAKYADPQSAVTAAQALGVPVVVKFGRATYTISAPIAVTASDVMLDLGHSKIVPTFAGTAITFTGTSGAHLTRSGVRGGRVDLNNVGLSGVTFSYCDDPRAHQVSVVNGATSTGGGVTFSNCTGALASGVRSDNVGVGVTADHSPRTDVTGCSFSNMKHDGVLFYNGSSDSTASGNVVSGYNTAATNGRAGIHAYGSDRVSVTGNVVSSDATNGTDDSPKIRFRDGMDFSCTGNICSGGKGGGIVAIALSDIGTGAGKGLISGNTIRDVAGNGIQVGLGTTGVATSLFPVNITGNTIVGVRTVGASAGIGINVAIGADASVISSNYMEDLDGEGVIVACAATVIGNIVRQPGKGSLGSKAGIYITAGTAVVSGNYCFDDAGTPTMANGLRIAAGATVTYGTNRFDNATSAATRNDGTQLTDYSPHPDVQVFTATGTWTKPANTTTTRITLRGGGGGGGSGRRVASGTVASGGGGGGGGGLAVFELATSQLNATETVTVGAGGTGGAAITVDSTNGNAGGTGGTTSLGSKVYASGGVGGGGGLAAGNAAGGTVGQGTTPGGAGGGANGGSQGSGGGIGSSSGGAGGGGISATPVATAGGTGAASPVGSLSGGVGGAVGVAGGAGPSATNLNFPVAGSGGGGGGASTTGVGGDGGAGGTYSAGGGGGGASLNGNASGKGGDGAPGIAIIVSI